MVKLGNEPSEQKISKSLLFLSIWLTDEQLEVF